MIDHESNQAFDRSDIAVRPRPPSHIEEDDPVLTARSAVSVLLTGRSWQLLLDIVQH
eukprot:CAMPEP_0185797992 /NCGR_PEP_ID=MMETSP1174-20130828/161911_1 /TAXON_ID=35687 /ORGANISM="Dictyocha speculum, Strain CCMP1381" /LENGTH=56 /DNA_ID=CAMNT_0028493457 /DNA_START=564 /DNA_END=734 /DNA_ORIENTATION=-